MRLSALKHPSGKAWALSVCQLGKGGGSAQKQQPWQQIMVLLVFLLFGAEETISLSKAFFLHRILGKIPFCGFCLFF